MDFILAGLAVGSISTLVSLAKITQPIRIKLPYLGGLFWCPICLSYWIAIPFAHSVTEYFAIQAISCVAILITIKTYLAMDELDENE